MTIATDLTSDPHSLEAPPRPQPGSLVGPARPAIAQAEFLTRNRDDLFTLSQHLMSSISPLALQDAARPVIVSVRGAWANGKKIIPDAAREHMLALSPDFAGRENDFELWRGIYNDRDFEIGFFNYMHPLELHEYRRVLSDTFNGQQSEPCNDNPAHQCTPEEARTEFLNLRRHGGITFIHNDETMARCADIDIRIETGFRALNYKAWPTALTPAFKALSAFYPWARHIKIDVSNEELMRYEPFAREIESMHLPVGTIRTEFNEAGAPMTPAETTQHLANSNVPIYGVNIARPTRVLRQG